MRLFVSELLKPIQVVCSHNRDCKVGNVNVLGNPCARHHLKDRRALKGEVLREVSDEGTNLVGEEEQGA